MAIQHVWSMGYTHTPWKGDCEVLIKILEGLSEDINIENLCKDIQYWASKFNMSKIHSCESMF